MVASESTSQRHPSTPDASTPNGSRTPLHLDLTNHRALAVMADWGGALDGQLRRELSRPASAPAPKNSPPA